MDFIEHLRFHHPKHQVTLTHDQDITAIHWHPKKGNQLVYGDHTGNVVLCELIYSGAKFKVTKRKLDFSVDANMEDLVVASAASSKEANPVIDLKFDPHSQSYLLIAYKNGRILLGDTDSNRIISIFSRQSGRVSALQWIPHIPGGFLSTDARAGILRIWSVSQMYV